MKKKEIENEHMLKMDKVKNIIKRFVMPMIEQQEIERKQKF